MYTYSLSQYEKKDGVYFINNTICYGTTSALEELKKLNAGMPKKETVNYSPKRKTGTKIYGI